LVTAGYGDLVALSALLELLDAGQPGYLLQPPGEGGVPSPIARIEELAARYVAAVRSVQPEGPYALGGYSMGGLVAFEAARQLDALGQRVALLALLDTLYPAGAAQLAAAYVFLQRAAGVKIVDDAAVAALSAAARSHRPAAYPGRLTLFVAAELRDRFALSAKQWSRLALGGCEVVVASGRHDTMVRPPHAAGLAAQLEARLAALARADAQLANPLPAVDARLAAAGARDRDGGDVVHVGAQVQPAPLRRIPATD
jgi:thioesterase domain-containing protein